jgi:gliding motility-associated-like protein
MYFFQRFIIRLSFIRHPLIWVVALGVLWILSIPALPAQVSAGDCNQAVPVCTNLNFQISPNGFGAVNELGIGTLSNPSTNPASGNMGCLLAGEQNSTWVLINIAQSGTLQFSFGSPGPVQCFDWIMWRYSPATCNQILNNTLAPIRCNWNSPCNSFTGMAAPLPIGANATNFEPPLSVLCGEQYLVCFSNYSSAVTSVPLNFFGTAVVTCLPTNILSVTASPPLICAGSSSNLVASGGSNYTWSPATGLSSTTGASVTASPSSTTTYTVTGQNGCGQVSQSVVVIVIPAPVISVSTTIPTVCQPCNGAAFASVSNASPPILYSWSPSGGNQPLASNLCPGTYTLTVNAGGCVNSQVFVLPEPYRIGGTFSSTPSDCGINNGTATVQNIFGAVSPYTVTWNTSPVQSGNTATGLPPGSYTVTILDANNCRKDTFISVGLNSSLTATTGSTPLSCPNGTNATVSVIPAGGNPGYTITWNTSPIQSASTATGLGAGNYTATITDLDGCSIQRIVQIVRPPGLTLTSTYLPISCYNASDGVLSVVPGNSAGPYQYAWSTQPVQSSNMATGVSSGSYFVTVTDGLGCWERDTVILTNPPSLASSVTFTQPSCFGGLNGSATVITPPNLLNISFAWNTSPVQTTQTASGLTGGTYQVVVSNRTGCTDTVSFVLPQPPDIQLAFSALPASCLGSSNGSATVQASGGTGSFTYAWQTQPAQNTITATGLSANTWKVIVTDANLCADSILAVVPELPDSILLQATATAVTCPNDSNGTATLTVLNGNGPYQYFWFTQPPQTSQTATGLSSGTYRGRVVNSAGCVGSIVVSVPVVPPMQLVTQSFDVSCFGGSDGQVNVQVSSGTPGYSYSWNTTPIQTSSTAIGLSAGTWRVVVRDANACRDTIEAVVNQPPVLSITGSASPASCFGRSDGSAIALATGGTPPYSYSWNSSPMQFSATATGLTSGAYTVTARDNRNCQASVQVFVLQPADIIVTTQYTMPLCFGSPDGEITAQAAGGVSPYTYFWSNGQNGPTATGLVSGTWSVVATDANGCPAVHSRFLPEPTELQIQMSGIDLTCDVPPNNGIASVFASGGSSPYTYQWNGGGQPTQAWNTDMPAGTWTVVVQDRNLCAKTGSIVLVAPILPVAYTGNDTFKCAGSGMVPLHGWASGGAAPYSYLWFPNNGSLSNAFSNTPGASPDTTTTYYFQVVDSAGCRSNLSPQKVVIHPLPIADAGPDLMYCKDGPAVFLQGSVLNPLGGYSVQWLPSIHVFCDTCLTTYATPDTTTVFTLRVRSLVTGCTSDSTTLNTLSSAVVEVRPRPIADAGPDTTVCYGDMVSFCGMATGAGPNYSWFWSPGSFLSNAQLQCVQGTPSHSTQLFLVVQSNGCESPADTVNVLVTPLPVTDAGNVKNICESDSVELDGLIQQGLAQQYQWIPVTGLSNSGLLSPMASPTISSWYYLRGINAGCVGPWDSVQVIVHSRPIANAGQDTTICSGNGLVELQGSYSGGTQPVSFAWTPLAGLNASNTLNPLAMPLTTTLYFLETWSGTGATLCKSKDSILITVLPGILATLTADTNVLCAGQSIELRANGGQGSPSFTWMPGNMSGGSRVTVTSDSSRLYQVVVSEGACSDTAEFSIQVHPEPKADFSMSQPKGCHKVEVQFMNLSANALSHVWDFGDGSGLNNETNPLHFYTSPGKFPVRLVVSGIAGCSDTLEALVPVNLQEGIKAEALSDPPAPVELFAPSQALRFESLSKGGTEWVWDMGDGNFYYQEKFSHQFKKPGTYFVSLEVKDIHQCADRIEIGPYVILPPGLFIPNVFSPNGDGIQDLFFVLYEGDELFSLKIFDRWGVLHFSTFNKLEGWDGRNLNGQDCGAGTYFYQVSAGGSDYAGSVVLVR